MGLVTTVRGLIVIGSSILVGRLQENIVSFRGVWGALCLHVTAIETSIRKGVNFGYIVVSMCLNYF
jgi:hypothetical protein